jgi:N-acetylglucosamine-6-phosphate deacetylase
MTTTAKIINARVPGYNSTQQILVSDGKIQAIAPIISTNSEDCLVTDVAGDWCSLGGIDLQINGALGLAFPDLHRGDHQKLREICDWLWQQGIDGFMPTLVTTSIDNFQRSLQVIGDFMSKQTAGTAQVLGAHLEGPCLNPEKRGAHPAEYLLPLTLDSVKKVIGDYGSIVKIMTLAPELDPTGLVVPFLRRQGAVVSLGHSLANLALAERAFDEGATMVTHAFNAMPSMHHRQPGLLAGALTYHGVQAGFIADGQHVHPTMLKVLLRAANFSNHAFLVSDALAPLGLPDGLYPWDSRKIEISSGTARLPDGTLAGTTLPLLSGVDNLVRWGACDIEQGIALATTAPRRALTAGTTFTDYIGQPGTLLRWHLDPKTQEITRSRLIS